MLIRALLIFALFGCDFAPEPTPFQAATTDLSAGTPDETGVFVSALTVADGEGTVTLAGIPGSTKGGGKMRAVNRRTSKEVLFPSHDDGSFVALLEVKDGDVIDITWRIKDEDAESAPLELHIGGPEADATAPGEALEQLKAAGFNKAEAKETWLKWTSEETLLMAVPTESLPGGAMLLIADITNGRSKNAFAREDGACNMEFFASAGDILHVFVSFKGHITTSLEMVAPPQDHE